jgi:hypothetical protein
VRLFEHAGESVYAFYGCEDHHVSSPMVSDLSWYFCDFNSCRMFSEPAFARDKRHDMARYFCLSELNWARVMSSNRQVCFIKNTCTCNLEGFVGMIIGTS